MNTTEEKLRVAAEVGVVDDVEEESLDNALSQFRLLPENAIPISPTIGGQFSQRFDEGLAALKIRHKEWEENIKLFLNEQGVDGDYPLENIVRTTIESLVDFTYMKNPNASLTAMEKKGKDLASVLEKLLTVLINKKTLPGINLRIKILRQIIFAHLTNFGVLELTYQTRKGSIEQVRELMERVRKDIKEEQDPERSQVLYELLEILQKEIETRNYTGLGAKIRSPFTFIIDPNCQEQDLSDARWLMRRDIMNISHIKAEYTIHDEETNKYFFRYDQNIEFDLSANRSETATKEALQNQIVNDIMPDVDSAQANLRAKDTTAVVWVYDKTTRLIYLYLENDWTTPLWVYNDEMEISRFFPFFVLGFSASLNSIVQAGEVSHYKAFQTEINLIDQQISRIRRISITKWLFNSNAVDKQEVEKFMAFVEKGNTKAEALGLKVKEEDSGRLSDLLEPLQLPISQFKEVFDKNNTRDAIGRITRVSEAMRGAEFKTNTTNDAIETYGAVAGNRLEGLTGKIENVLEDILWAICEVAVSKLDHSFVSELLTHEDAQKFQTMSVKDFNASYNLVIAAGSTEKPTSQSKKKEAVQIIQMLGQFGTAAPRTVLSIVTRLLRDAFSRTLVPDEDLTKLEEEGKAAMQKGISTQQQQQPQGPQQ